MIVINTDLIDIFNYIMLNTLVQDILIGGDKSHTISIGLGIQ